MCERQHSFAGAPLTLDLVLTGAWFDAVESGLKTTEYREMTERWRRRIWDVRFRLVAVRFRRGYTRRAIKRDVYYVDVGPCPYAGWAGTYYRIHFAKPEVSA